MKLYLNLKYSLEKEQFQIATNIKRSRLTEVIIRFIESQMNQEKDEREANEFDNYIINLKFNLIEDTFFIKDNCNNNDLRNGILSHFVRESKKENFNILGLGD